MADGWVLGEPVRIEPVAGREAVKTNPDTELIQVPAGEFPCERTSLESGEVWISNEIPFRLVKSISMTGKTKTIVTLVGFEKK